MSDIDPSDVEAVASFMRARKNQLYDDHSRQRASTPPSSEGKAMKIDQKRVAMLRGELTKVRCWMSGFNAARDVPGILSVGIPGEDGLRQTIQFLDELAKEKP